MSSLVIRVFDVEEPDRVLVRYPKRDLGGAPAVGDLLMVPESDLFESGKRTDEVVFEVKRRYWVVVGNYVDLICEREGSCPSELSDGE